MKNLFGKSNNRIALDALIVTICVLANACILAGCGKSAETNTFLSIDKEGVVTSTIYEPFEQDYYDISELSDMASDEISYYNSEYISPKITLTEAQLLEDESMAKLVMTFDSSSDYSHFNQTLLFYGTVQEAVENGYELSAKLVDANGVPIDLGDKDYSDKHLIITKEKTRIVTPYNIEYASMGVSCISKKEADLTNVSADSVQLLLSK